MNVLAAVCQLLVALAFLSIPLVRHRFGPAAKAAADAELTRQGVRPAVLEENGLRFDAGGHETWAPVAVATVMTALAALNLARHSWDSALTWTFQSAVILMNVLIVHSNLTAVKSVEAAFRRKGDPELTRVDVAAFLKAAEDAFPSWVRLLQKARHTTVFGASALALTAVTFAA
ncbi:hypothetical protein ABZ128_33085 [Streptomyces sp. NPDC006326]|uniref:hypothetical protein n=1 Tax=Streptomyces sp. NPDC006326 TaxID=3156752 RepID=UPI0033B75DFF